MRIRNLHELEEVAQSDELTRLFITPQAEQIIMNSLKQNVELLVGAFGENGAGGYAAIIPASISSEEGMKEYLAELSEFNLQPDEWEFNDILLKTDTEQVCLQLFVMTECNLLLLYVKNGE